MPEKFDFSKKAEQEKLFSKGGEILPRGIKEIKEQREVIQRLVLDPEKNLDIVITKTLPKNPRGTIEGRSFVNIVIEKNKETIINFQELYPDVTFVLDKFRREPEDQWSHRRLPGEDRIDMPVWKDSTDILIFFHEIGHRLPDFKRSKKRIEGSENVQETKYIAEEERGAWAIALGLVRKFRKEKKIDFLKPFKGNTPEETRKNIEKLVHEESLGHYERSVQDAKYIFLEEEKKELKGIFTKKLEKEISGQIIDEIRL